MIRKFRDISLIETGGKILTVACDSCAGVGELPGDIVKADGYFTGYRTAFVALAETLALGAAPKLVANTLSVPMDGYGKELVRGIKAAAAEAGLSGDAVTGSTEDNFSVSATSLGVTVIGELESSLPAPINYECGIYLTGLPKSGGEVLDSKGKILTFNVIKYLKILDCVVDIIPVGSKGIAYEINQMEHVLNAVFTPTYELELDRAKSAGPATCAIFAASKIPKDLKDKTGIPLTKIGIINPK